MSFVWIPIVMTVVMLIAMFRPYDSHGLLVQDLLEPMFRILWIVPILVTWVVYLAAVLIAAP